MEEVTKNELIETEEGAKVTYMEPEESKGVGKFMLGAALIGAGLVGGLIYKNRAKLDERRIKKLEKRGYVVFKKAEVEVKEVDNDDFEIEDLDAE